MKKIVMCLLIIVALLFPVELFASSQEKELRVYLDGALIEFDVPPQIVNGRTLVPLRFISEALGADVEWDDINKTAIITKGSDKITITVGSTDMFVNANMIGLDAAPIIVENRTLVPLRVIAEAFQVGVDWDSASFAVVLISNTTILPKTDSYGLSPWIISAGELSISMIVKPDGSLWAWGSNSYNYSILGSDISDALVFHSFEPIKIMDEVVAVDSGYNYCIAVKTDGSLWAWGNLIEFGLKGSTPVKIADDVATASANKYDIAFIKTDGSLWMMGRYLNLLSTDDDSIIWGEPLKIMDDAVFVSTGSLYVMAIKSDNSLWIWGNHYFAYAGVDNDTGERNPIKLMDGVAYVAVGPDELMGAVITTDGGLWVWGRKLSGERSHWLYPSIWQPVKIMDDVNSVSMGYSHAIAVKTDGSLWAWGRSSYGRLGDGTDEDRLTPVKIMDDVLIASTKSDHNFAVRKDGSLWAWGRNGSGELGDGTREDRNSPIKIMDNFITEGD